MKTSITVLLTGIQVALVTVMSAASVLSPGNALGADNLPGLPELVKVLPQQVFAPSGFDDNDNAQVVVTGTLSSTCYKAGPATAKVDQTAKKIYVETQAYFYPGCWCLQVETPFSTVLDLGPIASGTYEVVGYAQNGTTRTLGNLPVAISAQADADDYLYAMVNDAYVTQANGGRQLVLNGQLGNDCISLKEVKVIRKKDSVIEVLPITEYKNNTLCRQVTIPFQTEVDLGAPIRAKTLIHVRSLSGQSINKMIDP